MGIACVLEPVPACTSVPRFAYRSVTTPGNGAVILE